VSAGSYVCNTGPICAGYCFERGHASFYDPTVSFASKTSACVVSNSGHTLVCDSGVIVSQTFPPGGSPVVKPLAVGLMLTSLAQAASHQQQHETIGVTVHESTPGLATAK